VRGIYDGMMFGRSPDRDKYQVKGTSYDQLIRGLDTFYSDYRNERIFVVHALQVVSMELRGESSNAIDLKTRELRELGSKFSPK
jgi:hypothetical protein